MSIVEVRGLCKAFGDNQVLKNLDFQIEKGEVVTLIGPSGGGDNASSLSQLVKCTRCRESYH